MTITPIHCPDSDCFWSAHGIPDKYTQARDWHLAAHRAEEHGETLTAEQIAYATRVGHVIPGAARTTAAAVAAVGALPVPVGNQPQPLDDQRLAEIAALIARTTPVGAATASPGMTVALLAEVQRLKAELATAREDSAFLERNTLPELRREIEHHQDGKQRWRERAEKAEARVAELEAERHTTNEALSDAAEQLRADRDRIGELTARARRVAVSHEHFIYDHSDPGTEALSAQYELINYLSAMPGETELPVNPVENALRLVLALLDEYDENVTPGEIRKALAEFLPREDMSDRRRRVYIDGKGDGWIDAGRDAETGEQDVAGITNPWQIAAVDEVRSDTGSLREIGRCW